jgi:hypothetical protein
VIEVTALSSAAAQASSISERLAMRLGLTRTDKIEAAGFRQWTIEAYLPSGSVDIQCKEVSDSITLLPTRMALVILPSPYHEMVLGGDWLRAISDQKQCCLLLDMAPDKVRIRFLAAELAEEVKNPHASFPEDRIDEGDFITLPWGEADNGPGYVEGQMSMSHHVSPDVRGRQALDRIAAEL